MNNNPDSPSKNGSDRRFSVVIGVAALALVAEVVVFRSSLVPGDTGRARPMKPQGITIVNPVPLSPPPPVEKTKDPMVPQEPVANSEPKPSQPATAPTPVITTAVLGLGPLAPGTNKIGPIGPFIPPSLPSTRFGWYAAQIQRLVGEQLRTHRKTRSSDFTVMIRIWPDSNGRIARAKLGGTTGNAAVDAASTKEILPGLQLDDPPPAGMPLPINLRLTAKRAG